MAIIRTLEEWQAYATWLEEALKQQATRLKEVTEQRDKCIEQHYERPYDSRT